MPGTTARLGISYPLLAETPDAEANFKSLAEKLDEILRAEDEDQYIEGIPTNGIINAGAFEVTLTINSATGAISSSGNINGGVAYAKQAAEGGGGPRIRASTSTKAIGPLAPPSLPAAGKFMAIALCIRANKFNQEPTYLLLCGAEKATLAEAEASSGQAPSEAMKVKEVYIKNTAGVYSIEKQIDRRPWCQGVNAFKEQEGIVTISAAGEEDLVKQFRVEHSGSFEAIVSLFISAEQTNAAEESILTIKVWKGTEVMREYVIKVTGSTQRTIHFCQVFKYESGGSNTNLYRVSAQVTKAVTGTKFRSFEGYAGGEKRSGGGMFLKSRRGAAFNNGTT